jgi:hypothetical protein
MLPDWFLLLVGTFVGAPLGMLTLALISLPHLNRVEAENARLRRLVGTVTEDVAK